MRNGNGLRLGAVVAVLGVVAAACGSSGGSSSTTVAGSTAAPSTAAASTPASTPASTGSSTASTTGSTTEANKASATGITADTITIGAAFPLTGPASSSFGPDTQKGMQARFDMENANGGVFGRKLMLVTADDGGGPQAALTAAKLLETKNIFAELSWSPFMFGAYREYQAKGIPVVGGSFDGPEWGDPTNRNMFTFLGSDPHYPAATTFAQFMKDKGATKLAGIGYGDSPSSSANVKNTLAAFKSLGGTVALENTTIPFGSTDMTAAALQVKQSGADGLYVPMVLNSDIAAVKTARQAGAPLKSILLSGVGYDQNTLKDPATVQDLQGVSMTTSYRPIEVNNQATQDYVAAIKKYGNYEGIPSFGFAGGWFSADLLIYALKNAGSNNPTAKSFIDDFHSKVKGYDGNGILPDKIDFSTDWGKGSLGVSATNCGFVVTLQGSKFVPENNGEALCGKTVPGSEVK
jgi:branched-chain amino acid transport system substrate-binding protein